MQSAGQSFTLTACYTLSLTSTPCMCWKIPHGCLHGSLSPLVMKIMSVQVCSECTSLAEAVQWACDPQQIVYDKMVDLLP